MKRLLILVCAIISGPVWADDAKSDEASGYEPMAVFEKFAGRTWRGEGTGPNGKPIIDVAHYEMILGGRAFQSTHRLENVDYGGRTITFYDEGASEYIFHYFTTAGFHTTGVIELTETGFIALEKVQNHPVYDEVHSEVFMEGDTMRVVSGHVDKQGNKTEGEERIYREIDHSGSLY